MRCFYSKGAFLVLLWTMLLSTTAWMLAYTLIVVFLKFQEIQASSIYSDVFLAPLIPLIVFAPVAGWLADVKLGNYNLFRIGSILTFSSSVLLCLCVLVLENVDGLNIVARIFGGGVVPAVISSMASIGILSCFVTALQLGLDQMPDASAENISSFISWFFFSFSLGIWSAEVLIALPHVCIAQINFDERFQISTLLAVLCTAVTCSSLFILAPKWLIIEPKSPQFLITIYQVVKFAYKHKAPLNRSAFTYWEEDIPSRIDLGKSKYGGPFTTEQVEDVKTFFKILVILLPIFFVSLALVSSIMGVYGKGDALTTNECTSALLYMLTYSPWWSIIVATIVYELGVYPLLKNRLPNTVRRIGIASFFVLILNSGLLILAVTEYFNPELHLLQEIWRYVVVNIFNGVVTLLLLTGVLEFVCAQSPYNIRGLLTGYTNFVLFLSMSLGALAFELADFFRTSTHVVIYGSISAFLSLLGLILYCVLAQWYKMRVRDEDYSPHRVVEEVYDRYLSQAHANMKNNYF